MIECSVGRHDTVALFEWRIPAMSFTCCQLTLPAASVVSGPVDLWRRYLFSSTVIW